MSFNERKEKPLKHLFDGSELNVYDMKVINLSAGTPSDSLLKDCCEIFKEATEARMVRKTKIKSFHFKSLIKFINHLLGNRKHLIRKKSRLISF